METTKDIYKSIPEIMAEMEAITKDQKNTQQGFMFRGIDDVYNALQKLMAKHGVFSYPLLITSIKNDSITSKAGNNGSHIINQYIFRFCAKDSSSIDVITIGEAIDYGDKAFNKAAAIAHKYALLQTFCIPTKDDKDPDKETHEVIKPKEVHKANGSLKDALLAIKAVYLLQDLDKLKKMASERTWSDSEFKILLDAFELKHNELIQGDIPF